MKTGYKISFIHRKDFHKNNTIISESHFYFNINLAELLRIGLSLSENLLIRGKFHIRRLEAKSAENGECESIW